VNPKRKRKGRKLKSFTDLSNFYGAYHGEKCFIVGAGPSLALLDLSGIHKHVVISVNSSALVMPWKDGDAEKRFWISNDVLCMRWSYFWTHVARAQCVKVVRTSWRKYEDKLVGYNFRYFAVRKSEDPLLPDDPGLCFTSSVPTAIDFALRLECKQIYLLGVDQTMIHGNSHFWQRWPKESWPRRSDKKKYFRPEQKHQIKVFENNERVFKALHKLASQSDVDIYNCSNISRLKEFPMLSLDDALRI
jgi:hypothetical protein